MTFGDVAIMCALAASSGAESHEQAAYWLLVGLSTWALFYDGPCCCQEESGA